MGKNKGKVEIAMKIFNKRSLAWLTSLLMVVSLFSAVIVLPAEAANVDYVYSGKYVYNWGTREEVATFETPMAESWYAKNNTSYEKLSALSGSTAVSSVPSSALYKELQRLMKSNHSYETSYSATKDLFKYTDCENSGGKISSFYSGKAIGPSWDGGWNREHTWPNSKGDASGNGENDIMMLRPTSTSENSSRGNKAYGESSSLYHPNSESGGKYDLRGDVARIMLFVYCRWGNTGMMWGSSGVMESREILLKWVTEDPVDTWELGRNDSTQAITGTRNIFVDYPELIFALFGTAVPADYQSPSGNGAASSYEITASVNNSAYGSVTVSGKNITATPKAGYAVSGYTILSGKASVVRNGNIFVVNADTDVSIRIDFAAREMKTVQFVEGNAVVSDTQVYSGDTVTLPAHSGKLDDGITFIGWVEAQVEDTTAMPTFYTAGSKYTVSDDAMLYALYSRNEAGSGESNSNIFEPYSGALVEGDYLVVFEGGAMTAALTDQGRLQVTAVTETNGNIIADPSIVWHFAPNGANWTMYNTTNKVYAGGSGVKNKAALLTSATDFALWTSAIKSAGYEFTNVGNNNKGINPLLRRNADIGFATYATNTNVGGPNKLYKRASGTTYYYTGTYVPCDHNYVEAAGQGASCGEAGSITYRCTICGAEYTEVIPATGDHEYDDGVVVYEPTCGADGERVYTCVVCGDTYAEVIPATGEHVYEDEYDEECDECGDLREVPEKPAYAQGDINGDGNVNNRDLALLQRHLNDWEVVVVEEMLDVNGDGSVNNRDLAALQRILNA